MKNAIISVLLTLMGAVIGAETVGKISAKSLDRTRSMSDKHLALFLMMNQWVQIKR